jgi:serine/threonine protein kinase
VEFLERLEGDDDEERWLVQNGTGAPTVAWFLRDQDSTWLERTERATQDWLGPIHPRVTQIISAGLHDDYVVVEIEDDRGPLLATAARQLTDPVERERWVVAQFIALGDALATLRRRDAAYVHRQLEPARMYVDVQGHARLRAPIPFVLHGPRPVRMGAGVLKGTMGYLSPEQARGQEVTAASDVFSFASNLYFALAGKRPFARDNEFDTLTAILEHPPHPLETHAPGLSRVLARAFSKEILARYPDPGTFAGELWQCVPDATDYDAVVSDRIVEWRANAVSEPSRSLGFDGPKCRMTWEQLAPTPVANVRHCGACEHDVVRVRSLSAIVPLLGMQCVSYDGDD